MSPRISITSKPQITQAIAALVLVGPFDTSLCVPCHRGTDEQWALALVKLLAKQCTMVGISGAMG